MSTRGYCPLSVGLVVLALFCWEPVLVPVPFLFRSCLGGLEADIGFASSSQRFGISGRVDRAYLATCPEFRAAQDRLAGW